MGMGKVISGQSMRGLAIWGCWRECAIASRQSPMADWESIPGCNLFSKIFQMYGSTDSQRQAQAKSMKTHSAEAISEWTAKATSILAEVSLLNTYYTSVKSGIALQTLKFFCNF
jgi:hypothetical protein